MAKDGGEGGELMMVMVVMAMVVVLINFRLLVVHNPLLGLPQTATFFAGELPYIALVTYAKLLVGSGIVLHSQNLAMCTHGMADINRDGW